VRSYLDHNATSTLRPEARAAMTRAMDCTGNASSVHGEGRAARQLMDEAREQVARAVGVIAPMVVFTSGGSEANNMVLKGAPVERIVVSAVEHPSVLQAATASGKPVGVIPVDANGVIDLGALEELLHGPTWMRFRPRARFASTAVRWAPTRSRCRRTSWADRRASAP